MFVCMCVQALPGYVGVIAVSVVVSFLLSTSFIAVSALQGYSIVFSLSADSPLAIAILE